VLSRPRFNFAVAASISGLLVLSYWLSVHRILQVDECQNVYVARLLATGGAADAFTSVTLFVAPLAWVAHWATSSQGLFMGARLFSLAIFWLNIWLLGLAASRPNPPRQRTVAFLGAGTLAPLWDFGFEIRHDNVLLTGLLLIWLAIRRRRAHASVYFTVGALIVLLQFVAFKASAYTMPMLAIGLIVAARQIGAKTFTLLVAALAGGLVAFVTVRSGYGAVGWWDLYVRDFAGISRVASGGYVYGPLRTLGRLLAQAPVLVLASTLGLAWYYTSRPGSGLARRQAAELLPESLLLALSLVVLFANRAAYPYNLVNVAPFAFLCAFPVVMTLFARDRVLGMSGRALALLLVAVHCVSFALSTSRHLAMTNARQIELMRAAEQLTDDVTDPVYDGVGMVPTRPSVHPQWMLHTLNIQSFLQGPGPSVREMLARKPAAVIIPNYRTDWLSSQDHAFIRQRYVTLADDFLLLGTIVPTGQHSFEIFHAGRYRILALGSDRVDRATLGIDRRSFERSGSAQPTIDGQHVADGSVELSLGIHRLHASKTEAYAIVWLGPRLRELPELKNADHRRLFVNWY
jgi:hypothetical protein